MAQRAEVFKRRAQEKDPDRLVYGPKMVQRVLDFCAGLAEAEEEVPVEVLLRRPTIETRVPGAREEALLVEAELRRRGWAVWREAADDGTPMEPGVGLTFTDAAWEWWMHREARGTGEPGNAEGTAQCTPVRHAACCARPWPLVPTRARHPNLNPCHSRP